LLSLKNESLGNLVLHDTRPTESKKGCDFEFWIGSNKNGWLRYAIQAKKITVSDNRYQALGHKVNGVPQIDILEKYSQVNRAIPLYCLFNYSEEVSGIKSGCPKYQKQEELGCSVTPLKTAREALNTRGAKTFTWFHSRSETLPWSCLVRCPQIMRHWTPRKLGFDMNEMVHKELPEVLQLLLNRDISELPTEQLDTEAHSELPTEQLDYEAYSEQPVNSRLFSQEVNYRPRWVGVVNRDND
jgi:hypothetical protein